MSEVSEQNSTLPPAQPVYILRGHTAQIHAVHFFRTNTRLISGDADGWLIIWDLAVRRASAVWQAHKNTVLGLAHWGEDKIISHGRDGDLCVWQYRESEEHTFSKVLPIDDITTPRKAPWLLYTLKVHALNFCSFAFCAGDGSTGELKTSSESIIVAVSGLQDGSINLNELPSTDRVATIPPPRDIKTGMLMAVSLHRASLMDLPIVLAGYESGHAAVWRRAVDAGHSTWQTVYVEKAHTQPIMSLGVAHDMQCFFTTSADAIIARHVLQLTGASLEVKQTKHAGQQSLHVRSDERIFATAGWDGRIRVYSTRTMKELAVLKWHKEGCYTCTFAELLDHDLMAMRAGVPDETDRMTTVAERRVRVTSATHWLVAGSKDGKLSLWDIY